MATPHRTAIAHRRDTAAELDEWRAMAERAGTTLSQLMRAAMRRTRTWTAEDSAAVRERTRQVARIGNNLNQIARRAHRYRGTADAVQVITTWSPGWSLRRARATTSRRPAGRRPTACSSGR